MLSRLKRRVKSFKDIVNTCLYIQGCVTKDKVDVARLLGLLNIEITTRIELARTAAGSFLLVFQSGGDEPDYTIKLTGRTHHE